jgi:hypothetical protein
VSKFDKVEWLDLDEAWLPKAQVVQACMSALMGEMVEKLPVPVILTQGVSYGNM